MKTINVDLGSRSYPVIIGNGLFRQHQPWRPHLGKRVLIVSNDVVAPLYLDTLCRTLAAHQPETLVLADGEQHKTVTQWQRILDTLVAMQAARDITVVALGGGVIGDLAGFAAACYMRGVSVVQAPTTLLAQVDASVGGKTAVNHPSGKNLIGAFHQPDAVLIDCDSLDTLPDREFRAGIAEVVKYGLIRDLPLFDWLGDNVEAVLARDASALAHIIERSVINKAEVVARDELEAGERALLNLGHTFAHAIETATGYQRFLHGEAVAIGMILAAGFSEFRQFCQPGTARRVRSLLSDYGLPTTVPDDLTPAQLVRIMQLDKKVKDDRIRLILLRGVGHAIIDASQNTTDLERFLAACYNGH